MVIIEAVICTASNFTQVKFPGPYFWCGQNVPAIFNFIYDIQFCFWKGKL